MAKSADEASIKISSLKAEADKIRSAIINAKKEDEKVKEWTRRLESILREIASLESKMNKNGKEKTEKIIKGKDNKKAVVSNMKELNALINPIFPENKNVNKRKNKINIPGFRIPI